MHRRLGTRAMNRVRGCAVAAHAIAMAYLVQGVVDMKEGENLKGSADDEIAA